METIIFKENFKKGLNLSERAAGKNQTLPILNNVLIETDNNILKLTATDLEIGINYSDLAKIEKKGKTAVPAKFLSNLINSLNGEKLTLKLKDNFLYLNTENQKSKVKTLNPDDFPIIPKVNTEDFIEAKSAPFCQGISQVIDFCSLAQSRPEISGIYFNFQKNTLLIAATDSFRLAEKTLYFEKDLKKNYSFILPQKTAREIVNIFSGMPGKMKICFSPTQILFENINEENSYPKIQLVSRLIEGDYPNYQEIIPKNSTSQITLSRWEFLNNLKAANLFSGRTNEVKVVFNQEKKGIDIFSQDREIGENHSFIAAKSIEGKTAEVNFNAKFLMEGLNNIKAEEISFELSGEKNQEEVGPSVLRPVGDLSYLYVVMPIRSV